MSINFEITESDFVRNAPDAPVPDATPDAPPTTDAVPPTTGRRLLDFTVVHGWLRGEHRCPFELHATGCRDLKKLLRTKQFSYTVLAYSRDEAMDTAITEHGAGQVWEQPCCLLKRMQAIGRA